MVLFLYMEASSAPTGLLGRLEASLLRRAAKHTTIDLRYFMSGGAWSLFGTALSWIIAIGTTLAFANLISKETFGTYQYILAMADLFGIFILSGIDVAVARSVARGKDGSVYAGLRTKIKWSLVGSLGSLALSLYYFYMGNSTLGWAFAIVAASLPVWETFGMYVTYLQGKKRFDLNNMYEVAAQFVAAVVLIPVLFFSKDVLIILTAFIGSWTVARIFFFFLTMRQIPPNTVVDNEMIPYGKHVTVIGAVNNISTAADRILIWHLLGPVSVAVYTFAQAVPMRATGVIKILNRLAFPKMAEKSGPELKGRLFRSILFLCIPTTVIAGVYVLLVPYVFMWFFPQYLEAIPYAQLAGVPIALQPFSLFSTSLLAQAKKRALYFFSFIMPVVRLTLFISLIPLLHLYGAVLAVIATKVIESIVLTILHEFPPRASAQSRA